MRGMVGWPGRPVHCDGRGRARWIAPRSWEAAARPNRTAEVEGCPRRRGDCVDRRLSIGCLLVAVVALLGSPLRGMGAEAPSGQMTLVHGISIVPRCFDPAESEGLVTPFIFYYALHDALVKPMPGNPAAPCLAESWSASPDGLTYEFVVRRGVRFHNGEPLTADDVKFSFERYRGASARTLKDHVAAIE